MNIEAEANDKTLDSRVRRAARRVGLAVTKSRRQISGDNLGGYMLFDPYTNGVVNGVRYELTPEDVLYWCDKHWRDKFE